jgi:hypothetical protein
MGLTQPSFEQTLLDAKPGVNPDRHPVSFECLYYLSENFIVSMSIEYEQIKHARVPQRLTGHAGTIYSTRSSISFLISAIALAGLRLLGHVSVQFMIVWQRYSLNGSSNASSRSPVCSSRESAIQR